MFYGQQASGDQPSLPPTQKLRRPKKAMAGKAGDWRQAISMHNGVKETKGL